ncbi:hypothetical protein MNBD_UNCLBAC01-654 [hydrothermal vent metagenome]|uniref:Sirohydrochlorin cobaltochelatase n=1 Tax=hydrothermal vent metagenome TaxID=652676 RepID=A0A3B1DHM7_9ZZZZ
MHKKIIMIVGHGSRKKESNAAFESFVQKFRERMPEQNIRIAYVELAEPALKLALEKVAYETEEITVLPLFLLTAGHIKHDIVGAIEQLKKDFPRVKFILASALGLHKNMIELTFKRLTESAQNLSAAPLKTSILMIGRGSSDTGANSDFCKLVRMIEEQMPYDRIAYCFMAIVRPKVEEALERLIAENPQAILIQPYLIFDGVLYQRLQDMVEKYTVLHPEIFFRLSSVLGEDALIFDTLEKRLLDAQSGKELELCVSCGGVIV